jgi:hypothetical protein
MSISKRGVALALVALVVCAVAGLWVWNRGTYPTQEEITVARRIIAENATSSAADLLRAMDVLERLKGEDALVGDLHGIVPLAFGGASDLVVRQRARAGLMKNPLGNIVVLDNWCALWEGAPEASHHPPTRESTLRLQIIDDELSWMMDSAGIDHDAMTVAWRWRMAKPTTLLDRGVLDGLAAKLKIER